MASKHASSCSYEADSGQLKDVCRVVSRPTTDGVGELLPSTISSQSGNQSNALASNKMQLKHGLNDGSLHDVV